MRLHVVPTPFYGANCVVVLPEEGEGPALVVDPSYGVTSEIRRILDDSGCALAGVLLTHGHPDHVWEAAEVASWGTEADLGGPVPVWLPGPDMYRMDAPLGLVQIPPPDLGLPEWVKPTSLRPFPAGSVELVPGLWTKMVPAPGHTEGSALFIAHTPLTVTLEEPKGPRVVHASPVPEPWALSADVIFAGSVGRTDLPGGDETQMRHSLRTLANALDPATVLVPGHGPLTTMAEELATNPYIARARRIG
ncbi:MBL fold metallo-hydrolase [Schaalia sp. 19OD2882]|uniref:MBL fold metallo-hydrolase n=1 Tax=Schaalia sp. 19OD2882 TaxID=2794089 RepID=UPI001C1EB712|nr:MBL fold metallo-hydrolase [Schaalia sp. 19OD2882]QWW20477.1 MBL fold metallo-hydrolase [Schaalia sp. 19OD2882]